jgi:hypothetical protein
VEPPPTIATSASTSSLGESCSSAGVCADAIQRLFAAARGIHVHGSWRCGACGGGRGGGAATAGESVCGSERACASCIGGWGAVVERIWTSQRYVPYAVLQSSPSISGWKVGNNQLVRLLCDTLAIHSQNKTNAPLPPVAGSPMSSDPTGRPAPRSIVKSQIQAQALNGPEVKTVPGCSR